MYYTHPRLALCFWENGNLYFAWKDDPDVIIAAPTAPLNEDEDIFIQVYQLIFADSYVVGDEEREALGL